jgi:acetyl esterase/lipase
MNNSHDKNRSILSRILVWTIGSLIIIVLVGYVAFRVSPWPGALLIRKSFHEGGMQMSMALEKHVPPGIASKLNLQYDEGDEDAFLDVYYPADLDNTDKTLPTIVWIHGGGWLAGSKDEVANYCKVLAGKGYTVVAVDYTLAPEGHYPLPLKQLNVALSYLEKYAKQLHIDADRIFLAGDSAGAQLAAQTALIITSPSYAKAMSIVPAIEKSELVGVILYCGPYDLQKASMNGPFGSFLRTTLWSYCGKKDFMDDPQFARVSVINDVTQQFPPAFISAGNADSLVSQSKDFAAVLTRLDVYVDTLFFPSNYEPELPHEYQFNLDIAAGQLALERSVSFLAASLDRNSNAKMESNLP